LTECLIPERIKIFFHSSALPICANQVVIRPARISQERGHELVWRFAVIERDDQWLNDRSSSVKRPHISPAFQVVCFRNMPLTKLRCLIEVKTLVYPQRNVCQQAGEFDICGCCI